ncbi:acyl-CoA dehydrogenase family member 11-like [Amphiura filiformis]|uniref:acyl-CoA dehydrogenase family member 11-like n=1 Tax=Amphiura filiformis TaxID=82378 RepID=UPI003B20F730
MADLTGIAASNNSAETLARLKVFINEHVLPAEKVYEDQLKNAPTRWFIPPVMEELKAKARAAGLWNLFLPSESGLTQVEYAPMAEEMGRSFIGSEPFNCSAPDAPNMELLDKYGSRQQKEKWMQPLLEGKIRSCYSMTEPAVASSDATNMQCSIRREGQEYVINGRKWWTSGAGDPRCKFTIIMGKSGDDSMPRHQRHSMIIVPMDSPGVKILRPMLTYGSDDAPTGHMEIDYDNVRVPIENLILGEGRGFEVAQGRLGPARIHHCMRLIGMAERALELMCQRAFQRTAFNRKLAMMGVVQHQIAESRIDIDQSRLITMKAAHLIDMYGGKGARKEISLMKVAAMRAVVRVIDRAIQVHGGAGVSQDTPLANMYKTARPLMIADGPDEVHLTTIAKLEIRQQEERSKL